MSTDESGALIDTSDMLWVHQALNGGLATASEATSSIAEGDHEQASRVSAFLSEVLWLLHAHHDGEDTLLYPLLVERATNDTALFSKMDEQHVGVKERADDAHLANASFADSALSSDGLALVAALTALSQVVSEHATEEETHVLPIAAQVITAPEWGALPGHALAGYRGERMWLPLGLVFEAMPNDVRTVMLAQMPPPVVDMWTGGGSDAFAGEMAAIRS